jgi:(p)ppGpp synthase/HD superfamily hydrolase
VYDVDMERFISPEHSFRVERAIEYLVSEYSKSGHNPKPVVLHSLRLSFFLLELGYETEVIVTGILHDLLEDSDATLDDIQNRFGPDIARSVQAVSFDATIDDPEQQYKEMFTRTIAANRVAVVVKAADLHANSLYISLVPDVHEQHRLLEKIRYFLELSHAFQSEPALQHLNRRYHAEHRRLESTDRNADRR